VYRREQGDLDWLIDVQKSSWNSKEEARFTLNFGVYVPDAYKLYTDRAAPLHPQTPDCALYGRIGRLTPEGLDRWWKLKADDRLPNTDEAIIADVSHCVRDYCLTFLRQFQTSQDVVAFLETGLDGGTEQPSLIWPPKGVIWMAYLGIFYYLADDIVRCRGVL